MNYSKYSYRQVTSKNNWLLAYDLPLDWDDYLADALPVVRILRLPVYHLKTFKDVNDIVDSASFDAEFARALIQVEHGASLAAVETQEAAAQLTQTLLFSTVLVLAAGPGRQVWKT